MFRYSLNWASSWSDWQPYHDDNTTLTPQKWSGTKAQRWSGDHVAVQYWNRQLGSSSTVQQGDLSGTNPIPRRYPHFFIHGSFNEYGYDSGLANAMDQDQTGLWNFNFMTEWPSQFQANVWGSDMDGKPDLTRSFGDVDNDTVLELLSPVSLLKNVVNITDFPPSPHVAYRISVNDATLRYYLKPIGSQWSQLLIFIVLSVIPVLTGVFGVWTYLHVFYSVKVNRIGMSNKNNSMLPMSNLHLPQFSGLVPKSTLGRIMQMRHKTLTRSEDGLSRPLGTPLPSNKRTVLIATMEYDIDDWDIKIKIGGLGVMARTMSRNLEHQNLVWVIPCVGGVEYPMDQRAKDMNITILGVDHTVRVQYHHLRNITYVLLDAPMFRQQTSAEPYPKRMDDIESAIYYSAW